MGPECPECGEPMISRANKTTGQRFWGCKNYPTCKGTRNTDGESRYEREGSHEPSRRSESRWSR
jgi:ssDNA-binding Zn-finger/Zn-ribbon topoisomerase 1